MDGGEVLGRAGRQRAVELGQRPRGGQRLGPLDQVAFEFAPQVALEAGQLLAVDRRPLLAVRVGGWAPAVRPSVRRIRCTSTPTTPEPSSRPKAAIASRARSRSASSSPRLHRLADQLARARSMSSRVAARSPRRLRALVDLALAGAARRSPARSRSPRRRGRSSGRRAARRRGGRPGTWRSSSPAPRGSRPARSTATCSSAAKASRISEVPTATPSPRSSSQKPSSFGAEPGRAGVRLRARRASAGLIAPIIGA